ncbi:uncharacterized protein [Watersipora subatra]|uniref:uncharacterized protein isoform X2 n=1 Tax=Watersipora subatra TaxID=2589382 RepID=UPI00355B4FC9
METQVMNAPPPMVKHDHDVSTNANGGGLSPLSHAPSMDNLSGGVGDDEVRTLFVSGLPMNATEQELYLLFCTCKGYEGSLLKITNKNGKNTSPVGFVTFDSKAAAENAKNDLKDIRFDPKVPQTIRLDFAKSNTKVTKPKTINNNTIAHSAAPQFLPFAPRTEAWGTPLYDLPGVPAMHNPNMALQQTIQLPPHLMAHMQGLGGIAGLQSTPGLGHLTPGQLAAVSQSGLPNLQAPAPYGYDSGFASLQASPIMATSPPAGQMAAPSNTLFVSNISPFCLDEEITNLFATFPGYIRLRRTKVPVQLQNGNQTLCAFVEYADVRNATDVMNKLQGFVLMSAGDGSRGGLKIEYAKSKIVD